MIKKMIAAATLVLTVATQVSVTGALSVSDFGGINSGDGPVTVYGITDNGSTVASAPAPTNNGTAVGAGAGRTPNCDVLGTCGETQTPSYSSATTYGAGAGRTPNCDVLGICGETQTSSYSGSTTYGAGAGRTPNCDVLGTCGETQTSIQSGTTVYSAGAGRTPNCDVLGTCPENNSRPDGRHPRTPKYPETPSHPQYPSYPSYPTEPSKCDNHPYPYDIDGHWSEIYVRRLYDLCIFDGYSDGSFRPDRNITRAEVVKTFLFAAGIDPNQGCYDADCGSPFTDLDMWQGKWIRPAYDRHIVQGFHGDTFYPDYAITRAEAVKIILGAFGYAPMNVSKSFFNDVNGWATGWVEQAHQLGIISGVSNGNFDPDRAITRAEVAKIVAKTVEMRGTHIGGYNNGY